MHKRLIALSLALTLIVAMFALPGVQAADKKEYEFVVITHSASISFWVPLVQGAKDAARHISEAEGVKITVRHMGPALFNVAEQRSILENVIQSGVDGIAMTIPDPKAFDEPVARALKMGIPVIGTNTDDPTGDNPRMAFVGQGNIPAGRMLGKKIVELVGNSGKIAIGVEDPGHIALSERLRGVKEILDKTNIKYTILNTTADLTQAVSVFESYLLANPDAKGIFSVDATGTSSHGTVIRNLNLKGKIVSGGWDLVPATLENIKNGYTNFTIDQNPYVQGYYPIVALWLYHKYGIAPSDVDSGAGIVDAKNVNTVLELAKKGYR